MSPCENYQELISRMIDGELSARERDELTGHLETCPDCAALYSAFSALSERIGSDLEEAPLDLKENVMANIRRAEIRKKNRLPNVLRGVLSAAACVAVIVGVYLGVSLARSDQKMSAAVYGSSARESAVVTEEAAEEEVMLADAAQTQTVSADSVLPEAAEEEADEAAPAEVPKSVGTQAAGTDEAQPDDAWHEGDILTPAAPLRELYNWDLSLLRELLKGTRTERTAEELEPFLRELVTLRVGEERMTVRLYEQDGVLYYLDPVEDTVYKAALTPAEWDAFFD